jgi:hypothetical protein
MQIVGTVVALGAAPTRAAAKLEATELASDVLLFSEDLFARLKRTDAGSLLFLLAGAADDPALAAATKAAVILKRRGGGDTIVVVPPVPAIPGPQARGRLERAAELTHACVVQPVGAASWDDAVRCFLEPLAIFGLVGVDAREIRALVRPRVGLVHLWEDESLDRSLRGAREVLVSCRLHPSATLGEVDAAAQRVRSATDAPLLLAGPEVESGPRAIAAVFS